MTTQTKPRPLKRLIQKLADARARHQERHRPTGFGFLLADRIGYLDDRQWDHLTASASIFLQRRYLQVLESFGPENLTPRYAMIFRDDKPVAAVAAQIVGISGKRVSQKKTMQGLKEQFLVCGNLLSWGPHGVAFAADEDPQALWPAVAEALYRIRRAEKLSGETDFVMVKDLPTTSEPHALSRFSYRSVETEPNMVLEIAPGWQRYEDYTGSLQGKYKKSTRQLHEAFAAGGCVVERVTDLHPHAEKIHALYLQTHEQAKVRPVTLSPQFIPSLAQAMGDDFRCTLVRKEDSLLGFVTTLKDGETAVGYYIGFDRPTNSTLPLYHRLLHATIGDAIELDCRRLSLGRTALEAKARLGAKPVPLEVWIRHRQPLVNFFVRNLLHLVHHEEAPERNPFK